MTGEFNGLVITRKTPNLHPRSKEALETFQSIARWIPCAISPFMDLYTTMCAGLPSEDSDEYA